MITQLRPCVKVMRNKPTSRVCREFYWVLRCEDADIGQPVSYGRLEPTPWKHSWVSWHVACFCWSRLRGLAWAPGSSRSPSAPARPHLWYIRGTCLRPPFREVHLGTEDGYLTAGCSRCQSRILMDTANQPNRRTCLGLERQRDTSPVRLSSSGRGRVDSCEIICEQQVEMNISWEENSVLFRF